MRKYDAVIFDMDGTLVQANLDFEAIRAELGVAAENGILETIEKFQPARSREAHKQLLVHELAAARKAELTPFAGEVLEAIGQAGLATALLTRNARRPVEIILQRFPQLTFDLVWSREKGPIKPEPDGVLKACRQLNVQPGRVACVGDFAYDVDAANSAGAVSVLFAPAGSPEWADRADFVIRCLSELPDLLEL